MLVLLLVVLLSFRDGEYGLPALIGTAVAIVLGPLTFYVFARLRADQPVGPDTAASLEPPI